MKLKVGDNVFNLFLDLYMELFYNIYCNLTLINKSYIIKVSLKGVIVCALTTQTYM